MKQAKYGWQEYEYVLNEKNAKPRTIWGTSVDDAHKRLKRKHGKNAAILMFRAKNPAALLSKRLPMSKWRSAKVKRLPGGRFQVRLD